MRVEKDYDPEMRCSRLDRIGLGRLQDKRVKDPCLENGARGRELDKE